MKTGQTLKNNQKRESPTKKLKRVKQHGVTQWEGYTRKSTKADDIYSSITANPSKTNNSSEYASFKQWLESEKIALFK